jgi:hypothetical protein
MISRREKPARRRLVAALFAVLSSVAASAWAGDDDGDGVDDGVHARAVCAPLGNGRATSALPSACEAVVGAIVRDDLSAWTAHVNPSGVTIGASSLGPAQRFADPSALETFIRAQGGLRAFFGLPRRSGGTAIRIQRDCSLCERSYVTLAVVTPRGTYVINLEAGARVLLIAPPR